VLAVRSVGLRSRPFHCPLLSVNVYFLTKMYTSEAALRGYRALPRRAVPKIPTQSYVSSSRSFARACGCRAIADANISSYEIKRRKALDMTSVGGSGAAQGAIALPHVLIWPLPKDSIRQALRSELFKIHF
jgi:hypothetical protein